MARKVTIVEDGGPRHKPKSCELTAEEISLLMQAYTADKSCILEADAMSLLRWAQHIKLLTHTLQLVLEGHLRVVVEGQEVKMGLPV